MASDCFFSQFVRGSLALTKRTSDVNKRAAHPIGHQCLLPNSARPSGFGRRPLTRARNDPNPVREASAAVATHLRVLSRQPHTNCPSGKNNKLVGTRIKLD